MSNKRKFVNVNAWKQINVSVEDVSVDKINVEALLNERTECKNAKNYARSDAIALTLRSLNVISFCFDYFS